MPPRSVPSWAPPPPPPPPPPLGDNDDDGLDILEFEFERIDIAAVLIHIVASDEEGADDDDNADTDEPAQPHVHVPGGYKTMTSDDEVVGEGIPPPPALAPPLPPPPHAIYLGEFFQLVAGAAR